MTNRLPPNLPLAIAILAAMTLVALRAAGRRPEPRLLQSTDPALATATVEGDPSEPAVTVGMRDTAGRETAKPPPTGRLDGSVEQMQYVFHELHGDGHHALCEVCGN